MDGESMEEPSDYDWDEYFMIVAFRMAKRSEDPETKVGACIVDNKKVIVGVGYNKMPIGCTDLHWDRKKFYVHHAEMTAILNKKCLCLDGCTIYAAFFPCNECAKCIIQSGIQEVVYMSDKHTDKKRSYASKRMFAAANIKVRKFIPKEEQIIIDFAEIDKEVEPDSE